MQFSVNTTYTSSPTNDADCLGNFLASNSPDCRHVVHSIGMYFEESGYENFLCQKLLERLCSFIKHAFLIYEIDTYMAIE